MSTNRLYDSLLSLPLFLGMTRYDFQNVAGKTRFDFQKLEAGETIVEEEHQLYTSILFNKWRY